MAEAVQGGVAVKSRLSQGQLRLTLPLALVTALLLALCAPCTWFAMEVGRLRSDAANLAEELVEEVGPLVQTNPGLWKYNRPKLESVLRSRSRLMPELIPLIADQQNVLAAGTADDGIGIWASAAVPGDVATVHVKARMGPTLAVALLMLVLFTVAGAGVAGTLYLLPRRRLLLAEQRERLAQQSLLMSELARETFKSAENERLRISQELHDSVGQMLTASRLSLEVMLASAEASANDRGCGQFLEKAVKTRDLLGQTAQTLRATIESLGFTSAELADFRGSLETLLQTMEDGGAKLRLEYRLEEGRRIRAHVAAALFQTVREGLVNSLRHGSSSEVEVRLTCHDGKLCLEVEDNGTGVGGGTVEGRGLAGVRKRAMLLEGTWSLEPGAEGGARLRLEIPAETVWDVER